jgi:hypothetical protein
MSEFSSLMPIISGETRREIETRLHLDTDNTTKGLLAAITGKEQESPRAALRNLAEGVFSSVSVYSRPFSESLFGIFEKASFFDRSESVNTDYLDDLTAGAALVLLAFQIQTGQELYSHLARLEEQDLSEMEVFVEKNITPFSKLNQVSILGRVLNASQLPETQIDLQGVLLAASEKAKIYLSSSTKEGAVAMFYGLGRVWSKLDIPQPPVDTE